MGVEVKVRAEGFNASAEQIRAEVEKQIGIATKFIEDDVIYDVFLTKNKIGCHCVIKIQKGTEFMQSEADGINIKFAIANASKGFLKQAARRKAKKQDKQKKRRKSIRKEESFVEDLEDIDLEGELAEHFEDVIDSDK